MASRKPPPIPTQEPDDLLADPLEADDTASGEDGLVPPAIADDPEHDRLLDPEGA
jgi:hypothetical protein